jgi:hypothetical protein
MEADEFGQRPFDCKNCPPLSVLGSPRRMWHCGWEDPREWDPGPAQIPPYAKDADVCPGWLVRQQLPREIAQAYHAYEHGELRTLFPDPANVLIEGLQKLGVALDEKRRADEAQRKANHG